MVGDFDEAVCSVGESPWLLGTFTGCSDSHGDHEDTRHQGADFYSSPRDDNPTRLDFHHDGARRKGRVVVQYNPSLEGCGCYHVSEWHPGGSSAPDCGAYLPKTAPVTIDDANGTTHRLIVNQAEGGGQWNSLGCFDFDAGTQHLTASNDGSNDCTYGKGACYWIADAFKFEHIAHSCLAVPSWACTLSEHNRLDTREASERSATSIVPAGLTCEAIKLREAGGAPAASPSQVASGSDAAGNATEAWRRAFFICLAAFVLSFLLWLVGATQLHKRWRKALLDNSTKIIYLRPDAWPMQVMNPGGDDCLTVPVEPVVLSPAEVADFSQMFTPLNETTPSVSSRPSTAGASTAGSRPGSPGSRAGCRAGSRPSSAARERGGERGDIELSRPSQSLPAPSEQPMSRFQLTTRRVQPHATTTTAGESNPADDAADHNGTVSQGGSLSL